VHHEDDGWNDQLNVAHAGRVRLAFAVTPERALAALAAATDLSDVG